MNRLAAVLALALVVNGYGCVQMPTERASVVDLRPQLSFQVKGIDPATVRVYVDDLDVGSVVPYLEGTGALRVLPGTHVVRVEGSGRVLLRQSVYVGDGVARTLIVQ
jgi:hypothetical protein